MKAMSQLISFCAIYGLVFSSFTIASIHEIRQAQVLTVTGDDGKPTIMALPDLGIPVPTRGGDGEGYSLTVVRGDSTSMTSEGVLGVTQGSSDTVWTSLTSLSVTVVRETTTTETLSSTSSSEEDGFSISVSRDGDMTTTLASTSASSGTDDSYGFSSIIRDDTSTTSTTPTITTSGTDDSYGFSTITRMTTPASTSLADASSSGTDDNYSISVTRESNSTTISTSASSSDQEFSISVTREDTTALYSSSAATTSTASDFSISVSRETGASSFASLATSYPSSTALIPKPRDVSVLPTVEYDDLPGEWYYLGCLNDDSGENGTHAFPQQNFLTTTNEATLCLQLCESGGYAAGGMENGAECYCGALEDLVFSGAQFTDESECNVVCSGNLETICGGKNSLSYYQTD